MKEDVIKAVFIKYLQNLDKTPKPRKKNVPGPDVIIEGCAYECKGSKFKKDALFKQIISNAFREWLDANCLYLNRKSPNIIIALINYAHQYAYQYATG